jgi:alpha-mannosidase
VCGGHVNSWLMNNLHFTNFQARQDGTRRYRYRFAPTSSAVTRAQVHRLGRDLLEPLAVRQYTGSRGAVGRTGLRVQPEDVLFAEVRPLGGGTVRVRLRNPSDDAVQATVSWDGTVAQRVSTAVDGHGVADVLLRTGR